MVERADREAHAAAGERLVAECRVVRFEIGGRALRARVRIRAEGGVAAVVGLRAPAERGAVFARDARARVSDAGQWIDIGVIDIAAADERRVTAVVVGR